MFLLRYGMEFPMRASRSTLPSWAFPNLSSACLASRKISIYSVLFFDILIVTVLLSVNLDNARTLRARLLVFVPVLIYMR